MPKYILLCWSEAIVKKLKKKKTLSWSSFYEEEEKKDKEAEEEGVETGLPPRLILLLFLYWNFRIWPKSYGIYFSVNFTWQQVIELQGEADSSHFNLIAVQFFLTGLLVYSVLEYNESVFIWIY